MSADTGFRADLGPLKALVDVLTEIEQRRQGDAEAIQRLRALLTSLEALEAGVVIRSRLHAELPAIIDLLQPMGPIALAAPPLKVAVDR